MNELFLRYKYACQITEALLVGRNLLKYSSRILNYFAH